MDTMNKVSERVKNMDGREGKATQKIEHVTSALPSTTWLILAGGSIVASLVLKLVGKHQTANFVGQWAPTMLLLGIYNKIVKVAGSERSNGLQA